MGSSQQHQVTELENCRVSPPMGSVPPSLLPLTYFDIFCNQIPPVKRLFLYTFPCSSSTFLNTHVPNLKHSLSLTLQRFFPLVGNLVPDGDAQNISYAEGDSVAFTVAESGDTLSDLVGNHPREARRFRCLVPELPICAAKQPVLALQVTVFPDHGIGVGMTTHHAAVDGSSATRFMRTWASISRLGDLSTTTIQLGEEVDLPLIDRSVIPDKERLLDKVITRIRSYAAEATDDLRRIQRDTSASTDMVRATFVLTKAELDRLRQWVFTRASITCSDFIVVLAVLWVCVVKASGAGVDHETIDGFAFFADCRGRPRRSIPTNYFGNCIDPCFAVLSRSELVGEDGMAKASKAVWDAIQGMKAASEPMENDLKPFAKRVSTMQSVAGSPKLGVYKVDFGWGKPKKVEVVSIDTNCAISLAENEDGGGGVEVGVALPAVEMDQFTALFRKLMQQRSSSQV